GLRPDTFPFLAVLLCAMGSLILLLLVMDRRAKAVARAKVLRAAARAAEEDAKAVAARQGEWERRRAALRAPRLRQDEEVRGQVREVQTQVEGAAAGLQLERSRKQALDERLRGERQGVAEQESRIAAEKGKAAEAGRQTEALHAQRARLTAELDQMAHT